MITFEAVRNVKRAEDGPSLSKLPDGFEDEIKGYLKGLDPNDTELKNAKRELEKIYEKRTQKIVRMALIEDGGGAADRGNMTEGERRMFESMADAIEKNRKRFFDGEKDKKEEKEYLKVLFLEDLPAFIGPDGKSYGPYKKEKEADLPIDVATLLIKKKLVK
ncbi:MAG: hypothetical protein ABH829_03815 [archaeon]